MSIEQLLRYFEVRPALTELYLVGSVVFIDHGTAQRYANQVKGKVDTKHKREVQDEFEKEVLGLTPFTREEAIAKLDGIELTKSSDYYLLQDLVQALELDTDGKSKAAYISALKKFKNSQK